jgi:hypothetical protein
MLNTHIDLFQGKFVTFFKTNYKNSQPKTQKIRLDRKTFLRVLVSKSQSLPKSELFAVLKSVSSLLRNLCLEYIIQDISADEDIVLCNAPHPF